MKRKLSVLAVCVLAVCTLTACGSSLPYEDYELDEYIKVGNYKGLTAEPYTVTVTEDEIQEQINSNLEAAVTTEKLKKGTAVETGDTVNIDYTGKINGKKFDGGSAEGYDLELGSGSFIDGFESGLIGKKVGEKVTLELTFPEDYGSDELNGKDVEFTVKINSATREVKPEYNEDFVKKNTDFDTIEEYEADVKKQLYTQKEIEAINNQKTELWSQALENTEVKKYPDEEVEHYIEFNSAQIDDTAKSYGVTREEVLGQYGFSGEEEFEAVNEDSSKLRVKQEMLIVYIADKENLSYTDEEKDALIADFETQGLSEEDIAKQTGRDVDEYVHIELLYEKVLDFLLENAKIEGN